MDKQKIKEMDNAALIAAHKENLKKQDYLWEQAEMADDLEESECFLAQYLVVKDEAKGLENELSYRKLG